LRETRLPGQEGKGVTDNAPAGRGEALPGGERQWAGSPASLDLDTAESMGFKLMKLLAGQLEGTLSVESAGGTTVAVSFGL
jgi:hypothetical protein